MMSRRERGEHSSSHMPGFLSDRRLMQHLERRSAVIVQVTTWWLSWTDHGLVQHLQDGDHGVLGLRGDSLEVLRMDLWATAWTCIGAVVESLLHLLLSLFSLMLICDLCNLTFISPFKFNSKLLNFFSLFQNFQQILRPKECQLLKVNISFLI